MVVRVDILTLAFHINFDKVTRTIELKRLFDLRVTAVDPFGCCLAHFGFELVVRQVFGRSTTLIERQVEIRPTFDGSESGCC